eukprot:13203117-Ditylum_brightwellii.AAC.1
MSEDSGDTTPTGVASNGANHKGPKQRKKKKKNMNFIKRDPAKGETPELTDHVYDTGPNSQNQFASTTKAISKFMMRSSKNAREFISAFDPKNLDFNPNVYPPDCDKNESRVAFEKWKGKYKDAEDIEKKRKVNTNKAF